MQLYQFLLPKTELIFILYFFFTVMFRVLAIFLPGSRELRKPGLYACGQCYGDGVIQEKRSEISVIKGVEFVSTYFADVGTCPRCDGKKTFLYGNAGWYSVAIESYRFLLVAFIFWGILRWLPRTWFDNEITNHYGLVILLWVFTYIGFRIGVVLYDEYSSWFFPLMLVFPALFLWMLWIIAQSLRGFYYHVSLSFFGGLSLLIATQLYRMSVDLWYEKE